MYELIGQLYSNRDKLDRMLRQGFLVICALLYPDTDQYISVRIRKIEQRSMKGVEISTSILSMATFC